MTLVARKNPVTEMDPLQFMSIPELICTEVAATRNK
jgi:hypothetical protein